MVSSIFPFSVLSSASNPSSVEEDATSTVEIPRNTSGEEKEVEIHPSTTKGTSEEEEQGSATNSSKNEGSVDPTTEESETKVSPRKEDKSEPNANNGVGTSTTGKRAETTLKEAEDDASRRTTDLWPENPIKPSKAKPLMLVAEVERRTRLSFLLIEIIFVKLKI